VPYHFSTLYCTVYACASSVQSVKFDLLGIVTGIRSLNRLSSIHRFVFLET
jgi:hypothetical protein